MATEGTVLDVWDAGIAEKHSIAVFADAHVRSRFIALASGQLARALRMVAAQPHSPILVDIAEALAFVFCTAGERYRRLREWRERLGCDTGLPDGELMEGISRAHLSIGTDGWLPLLSAHQHLGRAAYFAPTEMEVVIAALNAHELTIAFQLAAALPASESSYQDAGPHWLRFGHGGTRLARVPSGSHIRLPGLVEVQARPQALKPFPAWPVLASVRPIPLDVVVAGSEMPV